MYRFDDSYVSIQNARLVLRTKEKCSSILPSQNKPAWSCKEPQATPCACLESPQNRYLLLDSAVSATTSGTLYCVEHLAGPVLQQVWNVSDGIAVGEEVPSSGSVTSVVQPGAENEVGRNTEEDTANR